MGHFQTKMQSPFLLSASEQISFREGQFLAIILWACSKDEIAPIGIVSSLMLEGRSTARDYTRAAEDFHREIYSWEDQ